MEAESDRVRPVKRCGCGKRYDVEGWRALELVGTTTQDGSVFEFRNCTCGSTLTRCTTTQN